MGMWTFGGFWQKFTKATTFSDLKHFLYPGSTLEAKPDPKPPRPKRKKRTRRRRNKSRYESWVGPKTVMSPGWSSVIFFQDFDFFCFKIREIRTIFRNLARKCFKFEKINKKIDLWNEKSHFFRLRRAKNNRIKRKPSFSAFSEKIGSEIHEKKRWDGSSILVQLIPLGIKQARRTTCPDVSLLI